MTSRARNRGDESSRAVLKLHDPGDVVAMIPYVIGYWPVESVVVVALSGPRKRLGPAVRVDIAAPEHLAELSDQVSAVLAAHEVTRVFVVGYSDDHVRAETAVAAMRDAVRARAVEVEHALCADGSRWWCCDDLPRCSPPEGIGYDHGAMRISAEAVAAGLVIGADRDESRRLFARDPVALAAVDRAIRQLLARDPPGRSSGSFAWRRELTRLLGDAPDRSSTLSPRDIAGLAVAVRSISCRDVAWAAMDRPTAGAHLDLWAQVTRAARDDLLAGPCSLAGFAAWLAGDGTLARHAVERVFEVSADYPMAVLLEQALDGFLDPRTWDTAILEPDLEQPGTNATGGGRRRSR